MPSGLKAPLKPLRIAASQSGPESWLPAFAEGCAKPTKSNVIKNAVADVLMAFWLVV